MWVHKKNPADAMPGEWNFKPRGWGWGWRWGPANGTYLIPITSVNQETKVTDRVYIRDGAESGGGGGVGGGWDGNCLISTTHRDVYFQQILKAVWQPFRYRFKWRAIQCTHDRHSCATWLRATSFSVDLPVIVEAIQASVFNTSFKSLKSLGSICWRCYDFF